MKKLIVLFNLALILFACESDAGKKAKLEKLKKQEAEIKEQIATLESELKIARDSAKIGITVAVTTLKSEVFKNYIDVQGRVDADQNVALSTQIPGTITNINVKVGDEVRVGQILAETDARTINQQYEDLKTNAALVNQIYEKQKKLWEQKIGTEIQYLQAKANKESMDGKLATMQQQLSMTKIISPINGTVDAIDIKIGQAVAPGVPAIRVINFANLKVKSDVAETYASKIRKGSEVIVRFPDINDSLISKVDFVSRAINPATRTFTVEVLLDNKTDYHPNMVARLNINDYQSAQPQIIVPVRTIQRDESNALFVFVVENNKARKRLITVGKEYHGQVEVLSGLKDGDQLITLGYDLLNEGDAVAYQK